MLLATRARTVAGEAHGCCFASRVAFYFKGTLMVGWVEER